MTTITTHTLQARGYVCRREYITGQGYLGGDGVQCYRVWRGDGTLAIARVSTYRTARQAWAAAARRMGREIAVQVWELERAGVVTTAEAGALVDRAIALVCERGVSTQAAVALCLRGGVA